MSYAELIEEIQGLPRESKVEIKGLIESYLVEEERIEIEKDYKSSLKLANAGKLQFSSNIDNLLNSIKD